MRAHALASIFLLACLSVPVSQAATSHGSRPTAVSPAPADVRAPAPLHKSKPTLADPAQEIVLLRDQLIVTRSFQSDLLVTVWSFLGFLVALTLFVIGYNWFAYAGRYKRDKRAIVRTMTNEVRTQTTDSEQRLRAEALTERARIDTALEALRNDIHDRIQQSSAAQSEITNTAVSSIRRELTERMDSADKHNKWLANFVDMKLTDFTLDSAVASKSWSLAATYALHLIDGSAGLGVDIFLESGLKGLARALENGGKLSNSEFDDAPKILKAVPEKFREAADKILAGLSKSQVM